MFCFFNFFVVAFLPFVLGIAQLTLGMNSLISFFVQQTSRFEKRLAHSISVLLPLKFSVVLLTVMVDLVLSLACFLSTHDCNLHLSLQ